jgi:hypothetical protein
VQQVSRGGPSRQTCSIAPHRLRAPAGRRAHSGELAPRAGLGCEFSCGDDAGRFVGGHATRRLAGSVAARVRLLSSRTIRRERAGASRRGGAAEARAKPRDGSMAVWVRGH